MKTTIELLFRDDIQCAALLIQYHALERLGILYIPEMNKTDMSGTINLFKKIDHAVKAIKVFCDDKPDITYYLDGSKWRSARMKA